MGRTSSNRSEIKQYQMNQKVKKNFPTTFHIPPDPVNPAVFRFGASAKPVTSKHRLLVGPPVINKRWQLRGEGTRYLGDF